MKLITKVQLSGDDIAEAITAFLAKAGIPTIVTVGHLLDGLGDDLSLDVESESLSKPVVKKTQTRKRKTKVAETTDVVRNEEQKVSKTIKQEASEANEARLTKETKEKHVAVTMENANANESTVDESEEALEAQMELDRQAIIAGQDGGSTDTEKEPGDSTVTKAKMSIFKKRKK